MKKYNKIRMSLYKDIFITILLIIVSIPIWLSFDVSELQIAKNNINQKYINYEFLNSPKYTLASVSDEYALTNIETQDLVVYNYTMANASYSLVLKIDKKSTAIIDDIKLNVNHDVNYLKDFDYYEDSDYYFYIIDSDSIQGTSQVYTLSMWNDEKNTQSINKTFDYEFIVL